MSQVEAILVGASALLFSALRIYRVFDSEMVKESKLEDLKTIGIILGTAIGDAKGIPYETLTYAQCLELKPHALKSVFEKCAAENRCDLIMQMLHAFAHSGDTARITVLANGLTTLNSRWP